MFLYDRKRLVYTFNLSHYNHNNCKMKYWKFHLNFTSLFSHRPVVHVHEPQKQISGIYIYILTIIYKIGIRKEYMAWNQDSFPVHKICNSFTVFYLLIDQQKLLSCNGVTDLLTWETVLVLRHIVHFDNAGILRLLQLAVFNIIIFRK